MVNQVKEQPTQQEVENFAKELAPGMVEDNRSVENDPTSANWKTVLEAAIRGEAMERTLTWREALKIYGKSIFWSFTVSLCVVMQGYDMALIGSLVALPVFREKYGHYSGKASTGYQLNAGSVESIGVEE